MLSSVVALAVVSVSSLLVPSNYSFRARLSGEEDHI